MPYVPHDRFHDYFDKMSAHELQMYMRNIIVALKRVHSFGIIHRDVKPGNFLHDRKNQKYLLVDFGLAQNVKTVASIAGSLVAVTRAGTADNDGQLNSTKLPAIEVTDSKKRKLSAIDDNNETDDCKSKKKIVVNDMGTSAVAAASAIVTTSTSVGDGGNAAKRPRFNHLNAAKFYHGSTVAVVGPSMNINDSCTNNSADNDENALPPPLCGNGIITTTIPSPFKQPLKQSNENVAIAMTPKNMSAAAGTTNSPHTGKMKQPLLDSPLIRNIKSAVLGYIMHAKIERQRNSLVAPSSVSSPTASNNNAPQSPICGSTNKYNNNQSITPNKPQQQQQQQPSTGGSGGITNSQSVTMCCCYGKPTVCNICIVKKEVHATRAGTPGYRPPEVLLKYPNQTTAVDMWAIGVIMITIMSNCYPFFKGADDFSALAEMITVFGDEAIKKTARLLARHVCVSGRKQPLHLRKLCIRLRNGMKQHPPQTAAKEQPSDGQMSCDNCQQIMIYCLCEHSGQNIDFTNDIYPASAYDLMAKLLTINPADRISATDALDHSFFGEELS